MISTQTVAVFRTPTVQAEDADGERQFTRRYSFDDAGRITKWESYANLLTVARHTYTWSGDRISASRFSEDLLQRWDLLLIEIWTFVDEPDGTDTLIRQKRQDNTTDWLYRINANGKLTLSSDFDTSNNATGYSYQWTGDNLTSITQGSSTRYVTYTYNADGTVNRAECANFTKNYTYANGRLASIEVVVKSNNTVFQTLEFSYEGEPTFNLLDIQAGLIYGYSFFRHGAFVF